jgi:hypothetical protein
LGATLRVGRRDTCPRCGVDLHSCRQCRFHDPRAYNECREPQAERVLDKERGNICDYFAPAEDGAPRASSTTGGAGVTPSPGGAREATPGSGAAAATAAGGASVKTPAPGSGVREDLERLFRRR